ncbi:MAG: carbohydrate kinase family protein [Candidatus Flexifilum sp.]
MTPPSEFDVLVIGDINVDLILTGGVIPRFGQVEQLLDGALLTVGGSASIFACGAARLGLKTAFIGVVGRDVFGRYLLEALAERGIDVRPISTRADVPTGITVILSHQGSRSLHTLPGAMRTLSGDEIDPSLFARTRHIHIGSYFMLDRLRPQLPHLLDAARASGCTVSLDTNYDPTEQWDGGLLEVLQRVDLFLPNETELKAIAGTDDLDEALRRLSAIVPATVVKLGEKGGMTAEAGQVVHQPALAVDVVDTTGAGDTFDAGYVYGYLQGWSAAECLRFACACGSLSTRGIGGTTAQPTAADVLNILAERI